MSGSPQPHASGDTPPSARRRAVALMSEERFRKAFILLLVVAISAAFVAMIRTFLLTILLAAIFSGLAHPLYRRLVRLMGGRRVPASLTTLVLLLLLFLGPVLTIVGVVTNEALQIRDNVQPFIERWVEQPSTLQQYLYLVPGIEWIEPYRAQILTKAGELVGSTGSFLFRSLSATTRGTVLFFFHFFILLYTMFFFLMDGPVFLRAILAHLPLTESDKDRMLDKFTSVTRATLKGTVLIGLAQGTLGGLAFWAAGIDGAFFWGTVMVVLSVIPGIGAALVWVPAVIVLIAIGEIGKGIALALFCALVVGSVDNLLRPTLVGRDTRMHDLLILFSTLGGIIMFGPVGFIVGPILAALFITIWEIFGTSFRDVLVAADGAERIARPE